MKSEQESYALKITVPNKKHIEFKICFADSEILSYHSDNLNLIIFLKAWNEEKIRLEFIECIFFMILNSWNISDICTVDYSLYSELALKKVYDKKPDVIPYKIFQFYDLDDEPTVEVMATNAIISLVSNDEHDRNKKLC